MDNYQGLSIFVCGSDHADKQALCEDYSAFREDEHFSAVAVSAGGKESQYFRSYLGARFAVEAMLDSLTAFASSVSREMLFSDKRNQERLLRQLKGSIIISWNEKVSRHLENYPFQQEELDSIEGDESEKYKRGYQNGVDPEYAYRANVTGAVITDEYCLIIRNGSGECVLVEKDGAITDPLPVSRAEDARALCRANVIREFSYCCSDTIPSSLFLITDGMRRCFTKQEDYHSYMQDLTQMLLRNPGDVKEYLKADMPILSRKGSHDDMCLAGIWSGEKLGKGPALLWNRNVEWGQDKEWMRLLRRKDEEWERIQKEKEEQERKAQEEWEQEQLRLKKKQQQALFKKAGLAAALAIVFFLFGGKGNSDKEETTQAPTTEAEASLEDKVESASYPGASTTEPKAETVSSTWVEPTSMNPIEESRQRAALEESIRESIREESIQESIKEESIRESLREEMAAETAEEETTEEETLSPETTAPPRTTGAPRATAASTTAPPQTAPPQTAPPETAPPETAPPETAPPQTNPPQPETPPAPPPTQSQETSAPSGQAELDAASQLLRPLQ